MVAAVKTGAFKRNVKWQMVGSASQALLSGLLLLLTGRELHASGFGVFSIIMGFVYVANLLLEPRIQDVAARQFWNFDHDAATRRHHSPYFIDLLVLEALGKLVPCVALVVLAPVLANASNLPPGASVLIIVAAFGTYFSKLGFGLSVGLLRVLGRSDLFTLCATGELVARLLLTLALVRFSELTITGCIVVLCISGIASNVVQWVLVARQFGSIRAALREWRPAAAIGRLRENRRLLLSNLGLSASDLMNKDLDITLISPLMPSDQVGIYKMAKSITLLGWRAVDPFYLALMPELSRLVSLRNFVGVKQLLAKSSLGLLALATGISLVSYLLLVLFGEAVLGAAFASIPKLMPWMLIGIVLSAPLIWGHPLAVALNRADVAFIGSLIGSAIGLAAFLLLTPLFGSLGAGVAWALTFLVGFMFTAGVSRRLLGERARQT